MRRNFVRVTNDIIVRGATRRRAPTSNPRGPAVPLTLFATPPSSFPVIGPTLPLPSIPIPLPPGIQINKHRGCSFLSFFHCSLHPTLQSCLSVSPSHRVHSSDCILDHTAVQMHRLTPTACSDILKIALAIFLPVSGVPKTQRIFVLGVPPPPPSLVPSLTHSLSVSSSRLDAALISSSTFSLPAWVTFPGEYFGGLPCRCVLACPAEETRRRPCRRYMYCTY